MKKRSIQNSDEKARVVMLAGFLGAGKTTLLRQILSSKTDMSDTVVIVNEFGEIGIDGSLLEGEGSDIIELKMGCICCTLLVDLTKTLKKVLKRFNPRWILIEASGVANPRSINAAFEQKWIKKRLRLHKTITVLDADCWEGREIMGSLFSLQLETADLILMNKIDLLEKDKIREFLSEIHEAAPRARVVPTLYCRIDPDSIWEADRGEERTEEIVRLKQAYGIDEIAHGPTGLDHGAQAAKDGFVAFSFQDPRPVDEKSFKKFMEKLPFEVFRVKGPVRFEDQTMLLNFVGGRSEWTPWEGAPETRLAFVGWDVDGDRTLRELKKCIVC